MKKSIGNKGFTLVELIVVITIIAILGTVAFVALGGNKTAPRDMSRENKLKQIASEISRFATDNGAVPNPNGDGDEESGFPDECKVSGFDDMIKCLDSQGYINLEALNQKYKRKKDGVIHKDPMEGQVRKDSNKKYEFLYCPSVDNQSFQLAALSEGQNPKKHKAFDGSDADEGNRYILVASDIDLESKDAAQCNP